MQKRAMPNGAILAHSQGQTWVCMADHIFLQIAARANGNQFIVTAQRGPKPNAAFGSKGNLSDDIGIIGNPCIGSNIGLMPLKCVNHGARIPSYSLCKPRKNPARLGC